MKISIIDYGACNIESVRNAVYNLGAEVEIIRDASKISKSDKIILPGVGAAKSAVDYLKNNTFFYEIQKFLKTGKPFLGICLGYQLLAKKLTEHGISEGLDIIDAEVINLNNNRFHIGWNEVNLSKNLKEFFKLENSPSFYFCHSYFVKFNNQKNFEYANTKYDIEFPSMIMKENILATQFHPEKSQGNGKILLERFIDWRP